MAFRRGRIVGAAIAAVAIAAAACAPLIGKPAIAPMTPPASASFPAEAVVQGASLAAVGDCAVCHTAVHGRPFAGGRALPTPFGTIYATNITPDPETGIGTWSEEAFRRAMRDGIDRTGRHLYPAFPYPHFTRATDQDIGAIYAFLMTRAPVHAETPANVLPFPLNVRATVAGWNLLFLRPRPWQPDPSQSAEWNRGAYLADAVGHCGACHTSHNALGAEDAGRAFDGGRAEGWEAPALQAASPAGTPWTVDALTAYLRTGFSARHGAAAGPMTAVTREFAQVPEQDVRAIAVYIASLMPKVAVRNDGVISDQARAASEPAGSGAEASSGISSPKPAASVTDNAVFAGACGGCHGPDAPMTRGGAPSLALSSVVNAPTPRDAIQMILNGIPWREGHTGPYMPGFAAVLSDRQVADLAQYLRMHFSNGPAWTDIESQVRSARRDGGALR